LSAGSRARPEERRLAAPGCAHEREQRRISEPGDELVDQTLPAEEELRVSALERGEPLERTDVAERPRPASVVGDVLEIAFGDFGLHRLEAATLVEIEAVLTALLLVVRLGCLLSAGGDARTWRDAGASRPMTSQPVWATALSTVVLKASCRLLLSRRAPGCPPGGARASGLSGTPAPSDAR
jgi:hypothetical protein